MSVLAVIDNITDEIKIENAYRFKKGDVFVNKRTEELLKVKKVNKHSLEFLRAYGSKPEQPLKVDDELSFLANM